MTNFLSEICYNRFLKSSVCNFYKDAIRTAGMCTVHFTYETAEAWKYFGDNEAKLEKPED